jgi:hypothetical protein
MAVGSSCLVLQHHKSSEGKVKNLSEGICELCGYHVGVRQKAHIMAEGKKQRDNILMLCPTCHIMFDTHVKPKVYKAFIEAVVPVLPKSWKKSIYMQAAEASAKARNRATSSKVSRR